MSLTFDPTSFECVTTEAQLETWVKDCTAAKSLSVDTETTGLDVDHDHAVGVSLALQDGSTIRSCYIPTDHHEDGVRLPQQLPRQLVMKKLKPVLESGKPLILHNALYDFAIFEREGITLANVHDTLWMGYTLLGASDPRGLGMDHLSKRFLNYRPIKFSEVVIPALGHKDFRDVDLPRATDYAAEDSAVTFMLAKVFEKILKGEGDLWRVYNQIDRPLIPVLREMRRAGVKVDAHRLHELKGAWEVKRQQAQAKVYELAGTEFDIASSKQLGLVLYDHLKIDCTTFTDSGARSTGVEALEGMDHPVAEAILETRRWTKLIDTYCVGLTTWRQKAKKDSLVWIGPNPETGRIHANTNATLTKTGRLSMSDPSLHQIPSRTEEGQEIRGAFIAEKGNKIVCADYSQIELRVAAHITGDRVLTKAYVDGIDVHELTAADVYKIEVSEVSKSQRGTAKTANFLTLYGGGPGRLSFVTGMELPESYLFMDQHRETLSGLYDWKEELWRLARRNGFVSTEFGRRIILPDIKSKDRQKRGSAERLAVSGAIQGTAADMNRLAMQKVATLLAKYSQWKARLLLSVHDELVIEAAAKWAKTCATAVEEAMIDCARGHVEWRVPIEVGVSIGESWKDKK